MSTKTDALRDLFMEVSDEQTLTESQEEGVSHDPIEWDDARIVDEVAAAAQDDGLADAIADAEQFERAV